MFSNFKHDMVLCSVCKKYLLGIFYQGYKCELCSQIAHKDCLSKTSQCTVGTHSPSMHLNTNPPFKNSNKNSRINLSSSLHIQPSITLERSMSTRSASSQQSFCVRAIYRYDGRPDPPELPVLMFNEGDLIQVKIIIQGHPIKSSSLIFDKILNFDRFLPAAYHFVEKSKGKSLSFLELVKSY